MLRNYREMVYSPRLYWQLGLEGPIHYAYQRKHIEPSESVSEKHTIRDIHAVSKTKIKSERMGQQMSYHAVSHLF